MISDSEEPVRLHDGLPNASDQAKWELRLKDFCSEQGSIPIAKKALELKRARECNVQSIVALDNALASMGKRLLDPVDRTLSSRLQDGEERKLVRSELIDDRDAAKE